MFQIQIYWRHIASKRSISISFIDYIYLILKYQIQFLTNDFRVCRIKCKRHEGNECNNDIYIEAEWACK